MKRASTRLGGKPYTPLAKSHFQGASRAERSEARCDGVPACWRSRSVRKSTPLLWVLVARVSTRLGVNPTHHLQSPWQSHTFRVPLEPSVARLGVTAFRRAGGRPVLSENRPHSYGFWSRHVNFTISHIGIQSKVRNHGYYFIDGNSDRGEKSQNVHTVARFCAPGP